MTIQTTHDLRRVIEAEMAKLPDADRVWWLRFTATAAMSMVRKPYRIAITWKHPEHLHRIQISVSRATLPNSIFAVTIEQSAPYGFNGNAYKTAPEAAAGIIMLLRKHWLPEIAA